MLCGCETAPVSQYDVDMWSQDVQVINTTCLLVLLIILTVVRETKAKVGSIVNPR